MRTDSRIGVMKTENSHYAYLLLLFIFCCYLPGCNEDALINNLPGINDYVYVIPEETGDGWETASLSSVGMDVGIIEDLINDINNNVYSEVHSVVIVKNKKLVFEEYFPGHDFGYTGTNYHGDYIEFDRDTRHNTHSATKSFTSALVGIAIDKGDIGSVNEKTFTYLPDHTALIDSQKDKITIEHMLTMSSGLEWNEWDVSVSQSNHDIVRFNQSYDPIAYLLSKSVVTEPGTEYYYNGGGVDLLGEIVKNASGQSIKTFSSNFLFSPLGITNYNWQTLYPSGITCCHGDIYITPRDMAKFGYLFLNEGLWEGNRIISEEWVNNSIQNHITPPVNWANGYGYLWWLKKYYSSIRVYNSFNAEGWGGQQIVVIPSENMVVVFTGSNYVTNPPNDEIMSSYILRTLN
jgi:CubicO group peptidase (beta-lactamase class C family)